MVKGMQVFSKLTHKFEKELDKPYRERNSLENSTRNYTEFSVK
jgi:hypothetical protein